MSGPLRGIKVLELSTMVTGPFAGMMLADMGASVIKVENPKGGDPLRNYGGGSYGPNFCAYNRSKRSIALDLRSAFGIRTMERLLQSSDVLLDNFRPGVLERLGFTAARIAELNSKLIWCSITGFGSSGPYVKKPAYDAVAQALSGMTSLLVDIEKPRIAGPTIADNAAGLFACNGIVAAIVERNRSGIAQRIEVNMLDAALAFMPDPFHYYSQMGLLISDPYMRAKTSQSYVFRCRDDKLICVHLSSQPKFWLGFLKALGRGDLASDERFTTRESRIVNYDELVNELKETFLRSSSADWTERLFKEDVPCAPAHRVNEVYDDPQVRHLNCFVDLVHPTQGVVKSIKRPVWINGSRDDQSGFSPPVLGEHTDEILAEIGMGEGPKEDSKNSTTGVV